MKRLLTTLTILGLVVASAKATPAPTVYYGSLGQVTFSGNFTLNHNFDFNNPSAAPFGTFATFTVASATGIFASYVDAGDTLKMSSVFMPGDESGIAWAIDGYTINAPFYADRRRGLRP